MDWSEYLRFLAALAFVLGLIGFVAWLIRRTGLIGMAPSRQSGANRRLSVEEVLVVDARRRLMLVRRDDRAHLILLGADRECVVERDIPLEAPAPAPDGPS